MDAVAGLVGDIEVFMVQVQPGTHVSWCFGSKKINKQNFRLVFMSLDKNNKHIACLAFSSTRSAGVETSASWSLRTSTRPMSANTPSRPVAPPKRQSCRSPPTRARPPVPFAQRPAREYKAYVFSKF